MRKAVLFLAMSLDGYIADRNGGVEWLNGQEDADTGTDSYSRFVEGIDTILMGWNTYHQVVTELSPTEWIYRDFTTYVVTHKELPSTDNVRFTSENPADLIRKWKRQEGKDIWICGGAHLAQQLIAEDLIDQYYISVIPTILGDGIRLWRAFAKELRLSLVKTQNSNGIVELIYERRIMNPN